MTPDSTDRRMQSPDPHSPLGGLSPADLLRQGAAEDTLIDGAREAFEPPSLLELAAIFPQFEILELIGQGGMGAVYKVRQRQLDRVVALKILPPGIGGEGVFADRFAREAKALAKLNHPGIVTIHEFGCSGGLYFIVMEFVDGVNLRQLLKGGRISPREALAIVPQICDALQFAHDLGIVHRDIKPENLLIDRRGRVKVADFGLVKLVGGDPQEEAAAIFASGFLQTEGGKVMGTPRYMAPEQIERPAEVDHRADIYALGVVFYQMLTGELPGERLEVPSRKVSIDVRLDEIVLRALEKDPELRFQQASVMKTRVEATRMKDTPDVKGGSPRFAAWGRWGWSLQMVGILMFFGGLAGMLRYPSTMIYSVSQKYELAGGDSKGIEERLVAIIRKHVPDASVARSKDSSEWMVTVRNVDESIVRDESRRVVDAVKDGIGEMLRHTESASVAGPVSSHWFQIIRWLLLAGVWAGLAGGLLLVRVPPANGGKLFGQIALGALLLSVLLGVIRVMFPITGLGAPVAMVAACLGFGVAGRATREGRWALIGGWIILFIWSAPMANMAPMVPHPRPPGFEIVPLDRAAIGGPPVRTRPSVKPSAVPTLALREECIFLIRDVAIHEVRHGENHPTTRERRSKLEDFLDEHPALPDAEMCLSAPLQLTEALNRKREQDVSGMGPKHPKSVAIDAELKAAEITLALCASRRREAGEGIDVEKP